MTRMRSMSAARAGLGASLTTLATVATIGLLGLGSSAGAEESRPADAPPAAVAAGAARGAERAGETDTIPPQMLNRLEAQRESLGIDPLLLSAMREAPVLGLDPQIVFAVIQQHLLAHPSTRAGLGAIELMTVVDDLTAKGAMHADDFAARGLPVYQSMLTDRMVEVGMSAQEAETLAAAITGTIWLDY